MHTYRHLYIVNPLHKTLEVIILTIPTRKYAHKGEAICPGLLIWLTMYHVPPKFMIFLFHTDSLSSFLYPSIVLFTHFPPWLNNSVSCAGTTIMGYSGQQGDVAVVSEASVWLSGRLRWHWGGLLQPSGSSPYAGVLPAPACLHQPGQRAQLLWIIQALHKSLPAAFFKR